MRRAGRARRSLSLTGPNTSRESARRAMRSSIPWHVSVRLGGELAGLADLLVEDGRGHVAAQLADTASEGSGWVSQPRTCVGGRGDDDLAHDGGFVTGPHRGGGQGVESFPASRVQRKR